jgi:hypothetical protein
MGLCSMSGRYDKYGCSTGPSGWESTPGLLKRFTNTGPSNLLSGSTLPEKEKKKLFSLQSEKNVLHFCLVSLYTNTNGAPYLQYSKFKPVSLL